MPIRDAIFKMSALIRKMQAFLVLMSIPNPPKKFSKMLKNLDDRSENDFSQKVVRWPGRVRKVALRRFRGLERDFRRHGPTDARWNPCA